MFSISVPNKANKPTLDFFSIRADFAKLLKNVIMPQRLSALLLATLFKELKMIHFTSIGEGNLVQRIKNDSFYFHNIGRAHV